MGSGTVLGHPTPSHGDKMKRRERAVTLKLKGRSTFPESLLCDGLPSTARTLLGLAGSHLKQGTSLSMTMGLSYGRWH